MLLTMKLRAISTNQTERKIFLLVTFLYRYIFSQAYTYLYYIYQKTIRNNEITEHPCNQM